MFRNQYQAGLLTVLFSCGASPLELWGMQVKNGWIRRITDEEVKSLALEIAGTNVATTFIYSPKNPKTVLGITLPFLVMIIKNMKKYFTFEITILDDKNMHRRFRISNFQSTTKVRPFGTSMPIGLCCGWNSIHFNIADFTRRAYGSNYVETTRLQIHANCRIRRIYFADKLLSDDEMPEEYKLLFPLRHEPSASKEKKDEAAKRSQTRLPAETVPADEPPAFRADSKRSVAEERTEVRTTPVPSAEPSRRNSAVVSDERSKIRVETSEKSEDEEEEDTEGAVELEFEAAEEEEEATTEREDSVEDAASGDEHRSSPISAAENEEEEAYNAETSENEEHEELFENQIE